MIRLIKDRNGKEHLLTFSESMDAEYAKRLDEGYFKSYPVSLVFGKICQLFGLTADRFNHAHSDSCEISFPDDGDYKFDKFNDIQIVDIRIDKDFRKDNKEQLDNVLRQCGWYIGDEKTGDLTYMILEPKYPIENDKVEGYSLNMIRKYKKFYHATFIKYKQRIIDFGLQPSCTQRKEFYHPERIYLFADIHDAENFMEIHSIYGSEKEISLEINARKIGNIGKCADFKYQPDNSIDSKQMSMFDVDLKLMSDEEKTINLYHDNRWNEDECKVFFTVNSIPPKYVNWMKDI